MSSFTFEAAAKRYINLVWQPIRISPRNDSSRNDSSALTLSIHTHARTHARVQLPFGVLLPIWLSVAPGEVGETALLIAGFVSIAAVLIAVTVLTCTVQPHLPFAIVDYWIDGGSTSPKLDKMFAVFVFLLPPTFLLPLYFEAQVSNAGGLTTLSFLGIYEVLVAVMYGVSIKERGTMGQNGVTFIESRSRPVSMLAARPVSNSSL